MRSLGANQAPERTDGQHRPRSPGLPDGAESGAVRAARCVNRLKILARLGTGVAGLGAAAKEGSGEPGSEK